MTSVETTKINYPQKFLALWYTGLHEHIRSQHFLDRQLLVSLPYCNFYFLFKFLYIANPIYSVKETTHKKYQSAIQKHSGCKRSEAKLEAIGVSNLALLFYNQSVLVYIAYICIANHSIRHKVCNYNLLNKFFKDSVPLSHTTFF